MSTSSKLSEEAARLAGIAQSLIPELDQQILDITAERAKLIQERDTARLAMHRLEKYPGLHGANFLCPYCWVVQGKMAPLMLSPPDSPEFFRCDLCLVEIPVA